jgi:uncharacterized secreted protein with C-terminal beta-propeller domain
MVDSSNKIAARCALGALMLWTLLILTGCSGTEVGNPDTSGLIPANEVQPLSSNAELEDYLKDQYARSINVGSADMNGSPELGVDAADGPQNDATMSASDAYTKTNIQEAGVDESDVVKTDGEYLYVASGRSFQIVDIAGDMQVVATRSLDGIVDALYLHDHKLVVMYGVAVNGDEPRLDQVPIGGRLFGMPYWIPWGQRLGVAIYDVSDPRNPGNLKTFEFDGLLVSSRLINGKLHIIQQFIPELPPLTYWYDGTPEDKQKTIEANRQAIDALSLSQLIPSYTVVSEPPGSQETLPLVSSHHFYCPASKDGGGTIVTITSVDLHDADLPFESVGLVADAHIVYASARSIYFGSHQYIFGAETTQKTTIHKFDLSGDVVRWAGGGVIPGWILNQFSLGEYQDVLRVAATTGHVGGWQSTARNNVYCLELKDSTLEVIGRLENLAPGEQIYAARFMGERGYLVTYVKIDPLFTLDLSDPTAPHVAGELKVPGYSDYIHPLGDDHLITVGKDTRLVEEDNMAWYQGVQLSIFDVSDFSRPTLLHSTVIGDRGTQTEASYNHKAFTFWDEHDLLALPINLYEHVSPPGHPSTSGVSVFNGLYVYRVSTQGGFSLLGRMSTESDSVYGLPFGAWTRGIFIDQWVYAVTGDAVRSAYIDQIEETIQTIYLDREE